MSLEQQPFNRRQMLVRSAGGMLALTAGGLVLSACGSDGPTPLAADGGGEGGTPPKTPTGTLTRSYSLEVDTLDPAVAVSGGLPFIASIYEGLLRYDSRSAEPVASLATAWRQSDDGLEWEFDLRPDVTFHDGEPFDSSAVKTTFEYFRKKKNLAASLLPDFRKIDVSDPAKIRFVLKQPAGDFGRNQAFLKVVSPKLLRTGGSAMETRPSGTGPFKFASRKPGRSITLTANDRHWGDGPHLARLDWQLITDASARVNGLLSGQLDQTTGLSPEVLPQITGAGGLEVLERIGWRIAYLRFFTTNPNVADPRVRQAIAYSIDRAAIVKTLLQGKAKVADSVMPFDTYGHVAARTQYGHDPDRARKLLQAAGVGKGHPIRLAAFPEASVRTVDIAQAMVGQLQDVGFDARLDVVDAAVVSGEGAKKVPRFDAVYDEHSWLTGGPVLFTIELIQALSRFDPKALRDLNVQQKTLPDGRERLRVLADMQNLVQDQAPYIALHVTGITDAQKSSIEGYRPPLDAVSADYRNAFRAGAAR